MNINWGGEIPPVFFSCRTVAEAREKCLNRNVHANTVFSREFSEGFVAAFLEGGFDEQATALALDGLRKKAVFENEEFLEGFEQYTGEDQQNGRNHHRR